MRLYMAAARWLLFFVIPGAALAVGLGEIRLDSGLNQPFSAEIPLESAEASELLEMEVTLASRETFDRYGLDRPAFLADFRFTVDTDANGNPVISVSSLKPVSEPFVTFLLDMRWGSGRLLREYTVLLDPPLFENQVVQPAVAAAQTSPDLETESAGQILRQDSALGTQQAARTDNESAYEDSAVIAPTGLFQAGDAEVAAEPQRNVADAAVAESQSRAERRQLSPPPVSVPPLSGSYTTQRGDTLWRIAERMRSNTGLTNNQMMLALYRANPDAFMGNINALKAGAILRMPAEAGVSAPGISEANNEVKQQNTAWGGGVSSAADGQARLELVAPGSVEEPTASGVGAAGGSTAGQAEAGRLQERIGQLESELGESQRLLQLRDAELQALQERIKALEQGAAEAGDIPADGTEVSEPGQIFVDETAEAEPEDAESEVAAESPATADQPAGIESDADDGALFGGIWLWGGVALALLLVGFLVVRRRQASAEAAGAAAWADDMPAVSADETLKDFSDLEPTDGPIIVAEGDAETSDVDATYDDRQVSDFAPQDFDEDALADFGSDDVSDFEDEGGLAGLADENDEVSFDAEETATGETELPLEKTISTGAPLNLDQADPIAEAEFHMAYGLYDQAADLLVNALEEQPENRAYRVKLLEVYFVWENKEGFLEQARALRSSIGDSADSDWSKVLILGKQLCPDDSLFAGQSAGGPISGSMDLELSEAGASETALDFAFDDDSSGGPDLDLSLPGEVSGDDEDALDFEIGKDDAGESGITLNLGHNPFEDEGATMESPTVDIDFADFGGDSDGATMESPTIESPFGRGDAEGETMESPTIESPFNMGDAEPDDSASTMETPTVETPFMYQSPQDSDDSVIQPTSLEVDLSGLTDLPMGELDGLGDTDEAGEDDNDSGDDIFGGLSQSILDEAANGDLAGSTFPAFADDDSLSSETENRSAEVVPEQDEDEKGFASLEALGNLAGEKDGGFSQSGDDEFFRATSDASDTAEQPSAQGGSDTAVQPQADSISGDTSIQPVVSDGDAMDLDLELGDLSEEALPEEAILASDGGLLLPDDATMTEVGTKLDLARAYIDMGDPDGARSILEEVLDEGGESQQQEARQLLDELSD